MSTPSDEQMAAAAMLEWEDEGVLEFDDEPVVPRAEGNPERGAYVQCWVWVSDDEAA